MNFLLKVEFDIEVVSSNVCLLCGRPIYLFLRQYSQEFECQESIR